MRVLTRYLLGRQAVALVVATLLVVGLVWTFQLLRLGHHLVSGAGGLPSLLGALLLYSLPTLLCFALPLALALAILFSLAQLGETGELDALRAAGASPLRLAWPGVLLCLLGAGLALLAQRLEPGALARLERTVRRGGVRAVIHGLRPNRFNSLPRGTVVYLEGRRPVGPDRLELRGLLISAGGSERLVLARRGWLRRAGSALALELRDGELQLDDRSGRLTRARFGSMTHRLELPGVGAGGLPRALVRPRAAWAGALALGLIATTLGLALRGRLQLVLCGLGAVVLYQLLALAAEQIGRGGPLLLAGLCGGGCVAWLARASRGTGSG